TVARPRPASPHLQPGNVCRLAVVLPADQPRDALALPHARAREQPVLRTDTGPIRAAVGRRRCAGAHQQPRVGTVLLPLVGIAVLLGAPRLAVAAELADAG